MAFETSCWTDLVHLQIYGAPKAAQLCVVWRLHLVKIENIFKKTPAAKV